MDEPEYSPEEVEALEQEFAEATTKAEQSDSAEDWLRVAELETKLVVLRGEV